MRKQIRALILAMTFLIAMLPVIPIKAASAMVIDGPASTYNIGDTFTATFIIPDNEHGFVNIGYSAGVISYVSSEGAEKSGGDGALRFSLFSSSSVKVTFKVVGAGTTSLTASCDDVTTATGEDIATENWPGAAGVSITVNNAAAEQPPQQPADNGGAATNIDTTNNDNSLSSLTLSAGSLSPEFKYNVTNYSATVGYDVTNVAISATCSNPSATIVSVEGNEGLQVGDNLVKIVVKAGNGVTATYKITITRQDKDTATDKSSESEESETTEAPVQESAGSGEFSLNGTTYVPTLALPTENIPADFTQTSIVFGSVEYPALSFNYGELTVIYLVQKDSPENTGAYYVYDAAKDSVYQFVKITTEGHYVIALVPEVSEIPQGMSEFYINIDGKGSVAGYQYASETESTEAALNKLFGPMTVNAAEVNASDFYFIYCMNDRGEKAWYNYDIMEGTFQRAVTLNKTADSSELTDLQSAYNELVAKLDSAKAKNRYIIIGMVMVLAVLIVVIVNLILANRDLKNGEEDDDFVNAEDFDAAEEASNQDDENDDSDDDFEEEPKRKGFFGLFGKKDDDFWDEEDDDEEDDKKNSSEEMKEETLTSADEEASEEDDKEPTEEEILAKEVAGFINEEIDEDIDQAIRSEVEKEAKEETKEMLAPVAEPTKTEPAKSAFAEEKEKKLEPEQIEDFMDAILAETMDEVKAELKNEAKVEIKKAPEEVKPVKPQPVKVVAEMKSDDEEDDDLEFLDL